MLRAKTNDVLAVGPIFDSGVEAVHPAFQDSSLTPPAGFPKVGAAIEDLAAAMLVWSKSEHS